MWGHDQNRVRSGLAAALVLFVVLGAADAGSLPRPQEDLAPAYGPLPDVDPATAAEVTITPSPGADDLAPTSPVSVVATSGALTDVQLVSDSGKGIDGVLTPDGAHWKPTEPLGYGHTYTLTVNSRGPGGFPARQVSAFSTLTPPNQTRVSFTTTSEAGLQEGGTYGVGTVIVAHFDEQITDRAAAERRLVVTTSPPVQGAWHWVDDQHAHWRPERYYAPGTAVTAEARIYGVRLANELFGEEDTKTSFTIGESHISIVDDATKQVHVYQNDALVRTMPTSMGMGGTEQIGDRTLSFWTPAGTYTVLDKGNPVIMDSSTFGLPKNSRLGYRVTINYATRISIDGIYLHELDATVWAQGNRNTSHGCLNLNADNARWFFDFSQPGDVVEIHGTGGPPLELAQNGDWSVPWEQWRAGSALT